MHRSPKTYTLLLLFLLLSHLKIKLNPVSIFFFLFLKPEFLIFKRCATIGDFVFIIGNFKFFAYSCLFDFCFLLMHDVLDIWRIPNYPFFRFCLYNFLALTGVWNFFWFIILRWSDHNMLSSCLNILFFCYRGRRLAKKRLEVNFLI